MNRTRGAHHSHSWLAVLTAVATLAGLLKIVLALSTIGTDDVIAWEQFAATIHQFGGLKLYYMIDRFNHPPFMVHVLQSMSLLTDLTGVPFPFWLRLPAILADIGTVILIWHLLGAQLGPRVTPAAVVLLAAAPASIFISGFHGNTDPVMIFFVLLSVYLIARGHHPGIAGLALGMSMNIKVVPVIFMPTIFLYLPSMRMRLACFTAAAVVFVAGSLPYLPQDPQFIIQRVFGYGSSYGQWGISRLLVLLSSSSDALTQLNNAYAHFGKYVALTSVLATSFWMNRFLQRVPLFLQCGFIALLFLTLSPGFGVQYLAWLVPWVVALDVGAMLIFYTTSGVFLFLVYTFWSHRFPWYFADSPPYGWRGYIIAFDLLCWVSVLVLLFTYGQLLKSVTRSSGEEMYS